MAEHVNLTIGFQASVPLNLRVPPDEVEGLLKAIGGDGWHDLTTQDGNLRLSLSQVLYVRTEREEHRVGFGMGS